MMKKPLRTLLTIACAVSLMTVTGKVVAAENNPEVSYVDCNEMDGEKSYTNYFIVGFKTSMENASKLSLQYEAGTRNKKINSYKIEGNRVVFYVKEAVGRYRLQSVSFLKDNKKYNVNLVKAARKERNVDLAFSVRPKGQEREASLLKVREISNFLLPGSSATSQRSFSDKLQARAINRVAAGGQPVVVIDPGHGGGDAGCNRTYEGVKYKESQLCLQIAQSCQKILEKNGTAKVFLTRSTDVYVDFNQRTQLAFDKGAALLVSFHLNATGTAETAANGAEAIYQNGNYNSTVAGYSKQLAQNMVEKLSKLGLKNRGIYYKNSAGTKYPDGTVADNFAINRQSKLLGIPGIIVEHCFLNNTSDFSNYLADSSKTDLLAKADAEGIAAYLKNGNSTDVIQTPQTVTAVKPSGMTNLRVKVAFTYPGGVKPSGYELYRAIQKDGTYTKVASGTAKAKYMVDASGTPGQTFFYKVRAYVNGGSGVIYGAFSDAVSYAILDIPQWIEGAKKDGNSLTFTWKRVAGADSYEVKRADSIHGTYTSVGKVAKTGFTDETVGNKTYFYEVRACRDLSDRTAYSKYSSLRMLGNERLTAKREGADKIVLSWSKLNEVAGYRLYRSVDGGGFTLVKEFAKDSTGYVDDVFLEKEYQYRLCSYVTSGSTLVESFGDVRRVNSGVKAPVILETTTAKNGKVTIRWEKNKQATGYEIYRLGSETESLTTANRIASVAADVVSYTDTKAKNGQAYIYGIRSVKKSATGITYSDDVSKVLSGTYIRTILPYSDKKIRIAWKKMTGVTGYKVFVSEKKSSGYRLVKTLGAAANSYIHAGRVLKKTYYYRVQTVRGTLLSKMISPVKKATMEAPVLKKISTDKNSVSTISWKGVSGAKGYQVFRSTKESGSYKRMVTTKKLTYTDKESVKKVFYYKVRAYFVEEGFYGYTGYSTAVTNAKDALIKPATPTLKEKLDANQMRILSWNKIAGVTGYKIYRSETGQEDDYVLLATQKGESKCSYDDMGARDHQVYYYRVRAYITKNRTVYSNYSNPILQATIYGSLSMSGAKEVTLTWCNVSGASCYNLYRQTVNGGKKECLGSFMDTSYVDGDVTVGESYRYYIAVGDGTIENLQTEIGMAHILGAVNGLKAETFDNSTKVRISFQACAGATGYELSRKAEDEAEFSILTTLSGNTFSYVDSAVLDGKNYQYRIRPLQMAQNMIQYGSYSEVQVYVSALTPIMGVGQATKEQMVAYYNRVKKPFPTFYANPQYGGVTCIEDFVQIIIEEASAEGVRPDLVAAQIFKETGYLQFGGDVKISQCNFAGLGAVGNGAAGASFPDIRTGIRAQVQHLKAYADSNATLTYACVDSRFEYVLKGSARYIEWLGIKENPSGKGWATAKNYGYDLVSMLKVMKTL